MNLREALFATALLVSGSLIVIGVASLSTAAAWVTAGILMAGWSWLLFGEA